jgi:hypothetical protein
LPRRDDGFPTPSFSTRSGIRGAVRRGIDFDGELVQRRRTRCAGLLLRRGERFGNRSGLGARETVVAHELVEIRTHHDEGRGHVYFAWLCGLNWSSFTSFAAAISFAESCALGVSSMMSNPRSSSDE